MEATIVTKGLVVKASDFRENDRLLTILTEDVGKITVTIRGGKSLKSMNLASSEVFAYSHFTFQKGQKYYYLKDSELIEDFYALRESIEKISLGSYFCEIASEIMPEGIVDNDILKLTLNALYALCIEKKHPDVIKGAFEFKCAVISGFMPDLEGCYNCLSDKGASLLDSANGRLVCSDCLKVTVAEGEFINLVPVTPAVLEALRFISEASVQRFLSFNLASEEYICFSSVCEKYMKSHFERDFYTLEFYKSLL